MKLLKQDKDYNCGVYATAFYLDILGVPYQDIKELEKMLKTDENNGTKPSDIVRVINELMKRKNNAWIGMRAIFSSDNLMPDLLEKTPCIVNYQYGGDGHYGVVVCVQNWNVLLYNPAIGELEIIDLGSFINSWYSERYFNASMITTEK